MQRLRVGQVARERIKTIERAAGGVVEACTQVLLAALHRPLAAVEDARQRGGGGGQAITAEHVAVGVVGILLSDGAECIQERPGAAVAVGTIVFDEFLPIAANYDLSRGILSRSEVRQNRCRERSTLAVIIPVLEYKNRFCWGVWVLTMRRSINAYAQIPGG